MLDSAKHTIFILVSTMESRCHSELVLTVKYRTGGLRLSCTFVGHLRITQNGGWIDFLNVKLSKA